MMRIRDFSLRTRLWAANFLMVLVPVCALALLGAVLTFSLQISGASRMSALSLLWPEKGPALTVQYLVSDLRVKAERGKGDALAHMAEDVQLLEQQGFSVAVVKRGEVLYVTRGADAWDMARRIAGHIGTRGSGELWDEAGYFAHYQARHNDMVVLVTGTPIRYVEAGDSDVLAPKDMLKAALWAILVLFIAAIVLLGRWLSRMLGEQVLEPLGALRRASAAIRDGDLSHVLTVRAQDEVGMACADFERMRQDLKRAKEEEIRYENNRKELIAGISHDLRTPLTALKGYVSGLRDGIARTPEKRRHYLDMMYESVGTLEQLVERLFLFSKLDLGKVPFQMESVHLAAYLEAFAAEHKGGSPEAVALSVRTEAAHDLVMVDVVQLGRVLGNLLDNSRKYRTEAVARVEILLEDAGGAVRLTWRDHGRGVTAEHLPRLFDSFYRTDEARSNVADGSGLGLAIVKKIVTGLQGTIEAEQTPGGGLTIVITLPLAKDEEEEGRKA